MKTAGFWNRPWGRFFYVLAVLGGSGALAAGSGNVTTINDVVYRADGTPARGTAVITWPAFTTSDNRAVAAGSLSVAIGSSGQLMVGLVPNSGGTPAGTYYKVVYKLDDGSTSEEYWSVPIATATTISAIRSRIVPSSVAMQVVSRQYVDSGLAAKADNSGVIHSTGDETIGGTKQFSQSPQVPDPTGDSSAVSKLYVDSVASARGVSSFNGRTGAVTPQASDYAFAQLSGLPASYPPSAHNHDASDVASGILNTNRMVSGTVAGSRCLQTSADGTQINETSGGCGGTSSNATQIQGRNICTNAPADGEAVTWEAASNCYKPKPGGSGTNSDTVDGVHAAGFVQVTSDPPAAGHVPAFDSTSGKYKPQAKAIVETRDYSNWSDFFAALAPPAVGSFTPGSNLTGTYNGSNANNVPILSYNIFAQNASGAFVPFPNAGYNVRKRYLSEWGYCGNNPAGDTAILNQALAAMSYFSLQAGAGANSNGNQTLVIDGAYYDRGCNFNNPAWPTSNGKNFWLTIEFNGRVDIAQDWLVPGKIALVGMNDKNSGSPAQFQTKPNSLVVGPKTEPAFHFLSGPNYVANLNVLGAGLFGGGTDGANGGANAKLENVAFGCAADAWAGCVPLTFDGFQWVTMDNIYLSQGLAAPTTPAALHLTNSGHYSQGTGNLHWNHGTMAGFGILQDSPSAVDLAGSEEFNDIVLEGVSTGAAYTVQADQVVVAGAIELKQIQVADSTVPCTIDVRGVAGSSRTVQSIRSEDNFNGTIWCSNGQSGTAGDAAQVYGAEFGNDFFTAGVQRPQLPTAMKHYTYRNLGVTDTELKVQQGTYPVAVPYATLNVPQLASGWASAGSMAVAPGKTDPWGGTDAAAFTSTSGITNWLLYNDGARTLSAGDWYIYGACLRPDPASGHSYGSAPLRLSDTNNVAVFDDWPNMHGTDLSPAVETSNMVGDGWECVAKAAKVTTGGAANVQFFISANAGQGIWVAMPWAMYVPASANISDREVIRWARTLRAVPSNAVAGRVYTPANLPLDADLLDAPGFRWPTPRR
jgi:hypothetical protein